VSDGTFSRAPWLLDPLLNTWVGQVGAVMMTYATLGWELLFVPLVCWPRTRIATLVVGLGFHLGIFLSLSVGMFGPASIWGYQAFLWNRWPPIPGRARYPGRQEDPP
jgi:hypothetical protein